MGFLLTPKLQHIFQLGDSFLTFLFSLLSCFNESSEWITRVTLYNRFLWDWGQESYLVNCGFWVWGEGWSVILEVPCIPRICIFLLNYCIFIIRNIHGRLEYPARKRLLLLCFLSRCGHSWNSTFPIHTAPHNTGLSNSGILSLPHISVNQE